MNAVFTSQNMVLFLSYGTTLYHLWIEGLIQT